jgi:spermidine synthase
LRLSRNIFFTQGAEPGIIPFFLFSFALLLPFCVLNGLFLPMANEKLKAAWKAGAVYPVDCAGSLLGGLLFSILLFRLANPFVALLTAGLLNVAALFILRQRALAALLIALSAVPFAAGMEKKTEESLFKGFVFEKSFTSRYGRIRLFRQPDSSMVLLANSRTAYSPDNTVEAEELAHLPLLQLPEGQRVLIISGGSGEILEEALKHRPAGADFICNDPDMLLAGRSLGYLKDNPAVRFISADARAYMDKTPVKYNCVLIALPDPRSLSLNRFFTLEFYQRAKTRLAPGGIIALALPGLPDYISPEFGSIVSVTRMTLGACFRNVLFFPGNTTVAVASDNPVSVNVDSLLSIRRLNNRFLNKNYLRGFFTPFRFDQLNSLPAAPLPNRDFRPALFQAFRQRFLSEFSFNAFGAALVAAAVLLLFFFLPGRKAFVLFSSAFAATGGEIILLTAFEIHFGTLYYAMSFLFAFFLLGLSAGFMAGPQLPFRSGRTMDLALLGMIPLLLLAMLPAFKILIVPLLLGLSFFSGAQFALLSGQIPEKFSGLYAADLLGGALGAVAAGAVLFPLFGPVPALAAPFVLKVVSYFAGWKGKPA